MKPGRATVSLESEAARASSTAELSPLRRALANSPCERYSAPTIAGVCEVCPASTTRRNSATSSITERTSSSMFSDIDSLSCSLSGCRSAEVSCSSLTSVMFAPAKAGNGTTDTSFKATLVLVIVEPCLSDSTGIKPTENLFKTPSRMRVRTSLPLGVSLTRATIS